MTVALTHATAADGTFSTAGAAAWNAGHVLTGAANSVPFFGGAANALTDSTSLTYDDSTKRITVGAGSGTSAGLSMGYSGSSGVGGIWSTAEGAPNQDNAIIQSNNSTTKVQGNDLRLYNGTTLKFQQVNTAGAGPSITAGTAADNTPRALSISQTWTDGTNSNIGIVGNFDMGATGTATGKLVSYQAGAAGTTEVFSVSHLGDTVVGAGTAGSPGLQFGGVANGIYTASSEVAISSNSSANISFAADKVRSRSLSVYGWTGDNGIPVGVALDTGLSRISAGVLGVGTGAAGSVAGQLHAGMLQASLGTALTLTQGAIGMSKMTASGSAPGATGAKFEVVAGTNAGTAKLIMYAGTSTTATTIIDNVGSGVS